MSKDDLYFRLRIPDALKSQVEGAAVDNNRSLTAEIIFRLSQSFDDSRDRQLLDIQTKLDKILEIVDRGPAR